MKLNGGYAQTILIGFICFAGPGFFNGLTALGAAGSDDPYVASATNALLYVAFSTLGFFGGALFNVFGNRAMFFFGGFGYFIYALAQFIVMQHPSAKGLAIASGAVVGIGAACLWTAQGACVLSYAAPNQEARYISAFWLIFSIGGLLCGSVMAIENWTSEGKIASRASPTSYYIVMGVMLLGPLISATLLSDTKDVVKEDGERVFVPKARSIKQELTAVLKGFADHNMHLMAPFLALSNLWCPYIFNGINKRLFNIRSRGVNSALFWLMQMLGSKIAVLLLNNSRMSKKSLGVRFFWIFAFYGNLVLLLSGYLQYVTESGWLQSATTDVEHTVDLLDYKRSALPVIALIAWSILDSVSLAFCMWMNSGLADGDHDKLARYSGFSKSIQSMGAAASWIIDSYQVNYHYQLGIVWVLLLLSLAPTYLATARLASHLVDKQDSDMEKEALLN